MNYMKEIMDTIDRIDKMIHDARMKVESFRSDLDIPKNEKYSEYKQVLDTDYIHHSKVGDIITLHHSTYGDIEFEIVGKDVDGKGLITLVGKDIVCQRKWHHTNQRVDYVDSDIRKWLNGEFLDGLDIKDQVKIVRKMTGKIGGGVGEKIVSLEKVWLLSLDEITESRNSDIKYPTLFHDIYLVKKYNGYKREWWLRSPSITSASIDAFYVKGWGDITKCRTNFEIGVVPCLCI